MSKAKVHIHIQTITPVHARRWLDGNGRNRKLDPRRVAFYAEQMKRGEWTLTNDAIVFNGGGSLLNGQHRLHACIQADTSFTASVLRGAPADAFAKMDTGKKRSPATILTLAGYKGGSYIAPIVRVIMRIEQVEGKPYPRLFTSREVRPEALLEFVERNLEPLSEAASAVRKSAVARPKSVWGALYFVISMRGGAMGRAFMDHVLTGEGCDPGSAPYAVRERAIRQVAERKIDNVRTADMVVHGWHAWLEGRKLRKAQGGRDTFPVIHGTAATLKGHRWERDRANRSTRGSEEM